LDSSGVSSTHLIVGFVDRGLSVLLYLSSLAFELHDFVLGRHRLNEHAMQKVNAHAMQKVNAHAMQKVSAHEMQKVNAHAMQKVNAHKMQKANGQRLDVLGLSL